MSLFHVMMSLLARSRFWYSPCFIGTKRMCYSRCIESMVVSSSVLSRSISTSHHVQAGKCWRISQGESQSGRDYGPLVDLPDWTYAEDTCSGQPGCHLKCYCYHCVTQVKSNRQRTDRRRERKEQDGRPAPLGSGQLRRQEEQKKIAERIDRLAGEMTAAIQTEQDAKKATQRKQYEINQHKLKPKGQAFRKNISKQHL